MLDRKEYESFFGKVSDAEWAAIAAQLDAAADKMWEEEHPLDD